MPKISVIVPIYKTEKYLDKCIESIVNQTYTDIEIILVDDGSPDNCPIMCDEWAKKDERIKVIHKENGGLSDARNAGIDIASGEYIGFVDGDDCILPTMYEKLYSAIEANEADLSICGYLYVDEELHQLEASEYSSPMKNEVLDSYGAMQRLCTEDKYWYYTTSVNRLYRKYLFDEIRFPKGVLHEDEYTSHRFYNACKTVVCIEDCLYLYVQRSNSITTSTYNIRRLDALEACLDRYRLCKDKYPEFAKHQLEVALGLVRKGLKNIPYCKWPKIYKRATNKIIQGFITEGEFKHAVVASLLIVKYLFKGKKDTP